MEQIIKNLTNKQSGFTLVELVVVVAVVGVLAVVATPKIVGVATDARRASLTGVASALTAASARNYAVRNSDPSKGVGIAKCGDITGTLEGGKLPEGYILDDASITVEVDARATCTIKTKTTPPIDDTFSVVGVAAAAAAAL